MGCEGSIASTCNSADSALLQASGVMAPLARDPVRGGLRGRSFLTLKDYTPEEIHFLLKLSAALKQRKHYLRHASERGDLLNGKNVCLIFEKDSTRTRCAFEVALFDEGGCVTYLSGGHFGKKESVEDSAKVLGRFYDGIQFRGYKQENVELLAEHSGVPVWNGLTDADHPTQVLADFLTIQEHSKKPLKDIRFCFVGDGRNNVSHALMIGCAKLGMTFVAVAPKDLWPEQGLLNEMRELCKITGGQVLCESDPLKGVAGADVLYTDVWVSMGEEDQLEARVKLLTPYQVNMKMLQATGNADCLFLHCLPAFHDLNTYMGTAVHKQFGLDSMEVSDEVFRSKNSVVFDEAENRMHTIKAVMVATMSNRF